MGRYWKCPKCGAVLDKGPGHEARAAMYLSPFSRTHGTVTCGGCQSGFAVQDVYGDKYDVTVESKRRRQSKKTARASETKRGLLAWFGGIFRKPGRGKRSARDSSKARKSSRQTHEETSASAKKRTTTRKTAPAVGRCGECYWYGDAALDGVLGKGICNYGSGQKPPFTMSPGDVVKIAWGKERGCEHFKAMSLLQKS